MDQVEEALQAIEFETKVFISKVDDEGTFVLETKLNNVQYLIEYQDDNGKMSYYCGKISLAEYKNWYEYEGRL